MARHRAEFVGEPITTPIGSVRVVSRVDVWKWGSLVAARHRPTAVEISDGGRIERHPVRDPGFLAAVSYAVFAILGRRR